MHTMASKLVVGQCDVLHARLKPSGCPLLGPNLPGPRESSLHDPHAPTGHRANLHLRPAPRHARCRPGPSTGPGASPRGRPLPAPPRGGRSGAPGPPALRLLAPRRCRRRVAKGLSPLPTPALKMARRLLNPPRPACRLQLGHSSRWGSHPRATQGQRSGRARPRDRWQLPPGGSRRRRRAAPATWRTPPGRNPRPPPPPRRRGAGRGASRHRRRGPRRGRPGPGPSSPRLHRLLPEVPGSPQQPAPRPSERRHPRHPATRPPARVSAGGARHRARP
mmetsp:Transcript_141031/g.451002  ORF Transcript_141031/g.451002 Transcript_141031/m.451002 type:complete len:277 (+) Transcript_141031:175-1005(+)